MSESDNVTGVATPQRQQSMPQQQPQQQQQAPVFIMVQPTATKTPDAEHFGKTFPSRVINALCAAQILIFVVCLIAEIVLITVERYGPSDLGAGIWAAIFFGIAGVLGILAAWKPTNCSVVAFLVLSIVASLFTLPVIVMCGIGLGTSRRRYRYGGSDADAAVATVFYAVMLFCGLAELVLAVTGAVIACRATCCRGLKAPTASAGQAVVYNAATGERIAGAAVGSGGGGDAVAIPLNAIPTSVTSPVPNQQDHPPKYEEAAAHRKPATDEEAAVPDEGERYQRFH